MGKIGKAILGKVGDKIEEVIIGKVGDITGEVIMGKVGENLVAPIQDMRHFNGNITELESQLKGLKRTREDVQMGVDENHRKVRVVGHTVEDWLTIADKVTTEAEGIIQDKAKVKEGCLNGWCPNLKLRYSLSRKAVKKTKEVVDLKADGVLYIQSSYSPRPACLETITNNDFTVFESRRANMEEIIKALTDDRIKLIGICGMAGVGKTTLVMEVAKIAKEKKLFDEVAFVAVGQNPDITKVQNSIAENFGLDDLKTKDDTTTRASMLRRRLSQGNKKILLILDDIWAEFVLEDQGIPLGGSHETFKIIYTSRFQRIWHDVPKKKDIPLELLSKDEAWQLFKKNAGDSVDARALQPIAKQIANECGRLPLALVVIGIALSKKSGRNTTTEIWEDMLERLTCASNTPADEKLSSCLALSYEYLEDKQAKRLFLLCCLFQEDEDIRIEDLARYGLGLSLFDGINEMKKVRRRVLALVDDLKSNYLLLDGKDDEFVKVHDVVRDMGISIASKNKFALVIHGEVSEWPKKGTYEEYTSISLISWKITELPKGLRCPNLEFLLLDCLDLKELPCQFFEGMEKLKVLVLNNFFGILSLPSSLRKLHTLSLSYFYGKLDNVSEFGGLFNMKTLSFRNSQRMELPKEVGKLDNLTLLDLTDTEVWRIPQGVISRLVHLEELYLNNFWYWEREGNEEDGRNVNLPELEFLSNLNALEIFIRSDVIPKFSIFSKLNKYKAVIVVPEMFKLEEMDDIGDEEFEHEEMDDSSDEEIKFVYDSSDEEIEFEEEMDDIGDEEIEFEEEMDDIGDEEFKHGKMGYDFKKKCKRALGVRSSITIPSKRGGIDLLLRSSDCLDLEGKGCNDLVQALLLRDGVDRLQQLKFLRIGTCDTPECLASTMNPVHLPIADAPAIFPILKALHLSGLVNLREICGGPVPAGSFGELTFIRAQNCKRLRNLFQLQIVGCLTQLKHLIISSCRTMEQVFRKEQQEYVDAAANRIEFPKLEVLKLEKLPSLMGFCRGIDHIDFPQLKELRLKYIPHVNLLFHNNSNLSSNSEQNDNVGFLSLFPQKVSLPNLEVLCVHKLKNLERLEHRPLSVGSLSKLKEFSVHQCGKLLCVIPSQFLPMLRELQELTVESCNSLEVVFELEGLESNDPNPEILPPLKFVKLYNLPKLNCISKRDPVRFKYIQTLQIHNCNSLGYVFAPTMTKSIPQLRKLKIRSCEMLSRIVAEENGLGESSMDEVEFPQLESLELCYLPNLVSFYPNVNANTTTLAKSTDHYHNPLQPQPLFNKKVAFPGLEYLKLRGLETVSDLWCSELPTNSFSKLKTLNVRGFANLRSTFHPSMVGGLANLSKLVIIGCSKMEGVVYWEEEIEDGQGRKVEKTLFPLLRKLQLNYLPNLVSFFPNVNTTQAKSNDHLHNPMQPQPLFNEKVAFSGFKYLGLSGLQNVSDLWGSELPTSSFFKLKNLQSTDSASLRSFPCILLIDDLHNTTQGLQEVAQLLYTNDGDGVLALGSNGTMTKWKWPTWRVTTRDFPYQDKRRSRMTNDVIGVNLEEAVPCMALSEDKYYIVSACGGAISLFSINTLKAERKFMQPPPASTFLAFHPQDNGIIAIGMEDSTIRIYNHREDGVIKSELKGHKKRITGLAFSTKLNRLVSSGADAQLCIWRIDTWEHLKSVSIQLSAGKACNGDTRVQFHSNQICLLVSHETQLAIYDAFEMYCIRQWVPQDILLAPISFAVYSCNSQLVYTSFCNGNIGVFDANSLTLACHIVPSIYLFPTMLSGSQAVYPRVIAANPGKPNQFAIGLTNGFVVLMEPNESEGKWGLSPSTVDNGMLNDSTASSSNTSNHTPHQNGVGPMARSMEKPKTLDDVTDKSKPWKVAETQCQLIGMPNSIDEAHKVAQLLYTNSGNDVIALGSNGTMTLWKWDRSQHNPSGEATASVFPQLWRPTSGLAMTNDVTGVNLEEAVPCMALSKNESYIISACGGMVSIFNRVTFRVMTTFLPPPPASTFLAFYPQDNNIIAIGMEDSTIRIYNVRVDELKSELKGHKKRITGLAFSTELNKLVSSGADAQLCIWSVDTWEHLKSVPIQLLACKAWKGDTRVQFHSDQIHLLVSHETQLAIYDASEMDCIRQWVPQDVLLAPISFAAYSCDSQLVYTSFCDGNIGVFDAHSLTIKCHIAPSIYLPPALLSGGQGVYPKGIAAHSSKPNQFAIGLTNGSVIVMEPQESEGKWGLSPTVDHNGMLNDRTASSSNTSNHTPDQFHSVEEGDSATSSAHILPQASGSESGLTLPALEEIDLDANLQVFQIGTYPQQPKPECYRRQPQRPKPKHNRRHPPRPLLQEGEIHSVVQLDESEGGVVP